MKNSIINIKNNTIIAIRKETMQVTVILVVLLEKMNKK